MNLKYNSFLLEKIYQDIFILLEGKLIGSERFLSILGDLSKDSGSVGEFSYNILTLFTRDYEFDTEVKQNYFDLVDEKDDKLSFIMNNKVSDIEDGFNLPGRNEMKVGRAIRYLLDFLKEVDSWEYDRIKDSDIEKFVNAFKSVNIENDGLEFKLIKGDDIKSAYDSSNYKNQYGTLGGSCMNDTGGKLKIYRRNEKSVKLLTLVDSEGKIHGRAFVWKLSKSPCECEYFMDRVYVNKDSDKNRFINFAKEKGWMYRKDMKADNRNNVTFIWNNNEYIGEIRVKLENIDFKKYPYLDTLCFLDLDKKSLSNLADKDVFHLQNVGGEGEICYNCDGELFIEYDDSLCDECGETHFELKKLGVETKWNKK